MTDPASVSETSAPITSGPTTLSRSAPMMDASSACSTSSTSSLTNAWPSAAEWGEVFGDPVVATALLDRLLHHAVVIQIEGSSYRLRQHADLMPEHLRSKAPISSPFPAVSRAAAVA